MKLIFLLKQSTLLKKNQTSFLQQFTSFQYFYFCINNQKDLNNLSKGLFLCFNKSKGKEYNLKAFISFSIIIDYNIQQKRKKGMSQILKSGVKCLLNSADSSEDNNRSTVKRLYSSVFSIIDNDQQVTDFSSELQTSRIQKLLENNVFMSHLQNKLRSEGLYDGYNLPIIRISVAYYQNYAHCPSYYEKAELDHQDMSNIFEKFGQINKIILSNEKKDAYIFFNSFINAYISFKLLRNVKIRGGSLEIMMEWVNNNTDVHHQISSEVHIFINGINWESLFLSKKLKAEPIFTEENNNPLKQNKFTCRYEIQIQNERQFQVARRIIGSKGCNMKRILQDSITCNNENKNYSNDNANQLLKLRLRGKGSGYKEGPEQQESNQSLHLCVSAKDQIVYNSACNRVEKLLTSIYNQYLEFSRRQGKSTQLTIKRINIGQFSSNQEVVNAQPNFQQGDSYEFNDQGYQNMMYRLSPQKISELLELRNKARRQLNFHQADRIRNYLRSCGVCLIDEKGRRGRAAEVTTWKYMY